jgi:hypothetical protein
VGRPHFKQAPIYLSLCVLRPQLHHVVGQPCRTWSRVRGPRCQCCIEVVEGRCLEEGRAVPFSVSSGTLSCNAFQIVLRSVGGCWTTDSGE